MKDELSLVPKYLLSQQRAKEQAHENILLAAAERRGREQGRMWLAEMGIESEEEQ